MDREASFKSRTGTEHDKMAHITVSNSLQECSCRLCSPGVRNPDFLTDIIHMLDSSVSVRSFSRQSTLKVHSLEDAGLTEPLTAVDPPPGIAVRHGSVGIVSPYQH